MREFLSVLEIAEKGEDCSQWTSCYRRSKVLKHQERQILGTFSGKSFLPILRRCPLRSTVRLGTSGIVNTRFNVSMLRLRQQ